MCTSEIVLLVIVLLGQSEVSRNYRHHIPAPPKPAPGHAESYNPPPEYIFTKEEVQYFSLVVYTVDCQLTFQTFVT